MYKIATIGGDGIGPEIVAEGKKVLEAAGERFNFDIQWTDFDLGADRYIHSGKLVTEDELEDLSKFRAIYFGAIGDERVWLPSFGFDAAWLLRPSMLGQTGVVF